MNTIRNNNPGNIRLHPANRWKGASSEQTDRSFVRFTDRIFGYRAMMLLLRNYVKRPDCRRLEQIIARWAPPSENNTRHYLDVVCRLTRIAPTAEPDLTDPRTLLSLCAAITRMEHGVEADPAEMNRALSLLGE